MTGTARTSNATAPVPGFHQVALADWTTRVIRSGHGTPALVLLHSHGVGADMWLPVMRALPPDLPALAMDLRGQGRSSSPRRPFSLGLLASDVVEVLIAEGIRHCTVAGVAFGGAVAQLVATSAPGLVGRLVLMDTAATRTPKSRQSLLARCDRAERDGLAEITDEAIGRWFAPPVTPPDQEVLDGLRATMRSADAGHYAAAGRAFAHLELRQNAAGITCPTLILVGEYDVAMPVTQSQLMHELIPGSELTVLTGLGHCPPLQAPGLVARLLASFATRPARGQ